MVSLNGHEAGNGGYSQGLTYSPSRFPLLGGHKAAATLTTDNMLQAAEHSKSTRLHLATFGVAHGFIITDRWWSICG